MRPRAIHMRVAAGAALIAVAIVAVLMIVRGGLWREPPSPAGTATVRLISAEQYVEIVHRLFGDDLELEMSISSPARRGGLIALGAVVAAITPGALEQFKGAARVVAGQVVDERHRATLVPCIPASTASPDPQCARQFFASTGRLLFRRPLTDAELQTYVSAAGEGAQSLKDFYAGLSFSLAGMLTSPKFLYIVEAMEPDPEHPGQVRLDAYAKASRLSLFLWDALPDEELLRAAEAGELHRRKGLQRQVDRLLGSPHLERGMRAFFADMLRFDKFDTLSKDPVIFPAFTRGAVLSAREQALRLITDHLLTHRGDYRALFTTPYTFVDASLAPFYAVALANPTEWQRHELDQRHSAGLLTSLGFLTLHSHPGRTSPTLRGRAIRESLLCQKVPDPPPNVNFDTFENPAGNVKTARERIKAHSTDRVCAGCHKLTDPIGLALENFDGAGSFRTTEQGAPIDTSGELDGQPFNDVASLGQAMRSHPAPAACLVSRMYAYGLGREMTRDDRPLLAFFAERFEHDGYRLSSLLREIAVSRAFFAVSTIDDAP